MTLQLLHSEFPYIWGKYDFFFQYRERGIEDKSSQNSTQDVENSYICIIYNISWMMIQSKCEEERKTLMSSLGIWKERGLGRLSHPSAYSYPSPLATHLPVIDLQRFCTQQKEEKKWSSIYVNCDGTIMFPIFAGLWYPANNICIS